MNWYFNLKIGLQWHTPVCTCPRWRLPAGWDEPGWCPPESSALVVPFLSSLGLCCDPDAASSPTTCSSQQSSGGQSRWSRWYRRSFPLSPCGVQAGRLERATDLVKYTPTRLRSSMRNLNYIPRSWSDGDHFKWRRFSQWEDSRALVLLVQGHSSV